MHMCWTLGNIQAISCYSSNGCSCVIFHFLCINVGTTCNLIRLGSDQNKSVKASKKKSQNDVYGKLSVFIRTHANAKQLSRWVINFNITTILDWSIDDLTTIFQNVFFIFGCLRDHHNDCNCGKYDIDLCCNAFGSDWNS